MSYISPMKRLNLQNVDYFQRNARGGHLVFQNEATFLPREAYPRMKISCKLGEPSCCYFPLRALTPKISTRGGGGVADAKPKYPPDASGGYNY